MSVNVGTLSARFGLDSAEFLEKLRGVTGATELFSSQMKREMNTASREGAESLHLLDHALGIQLPRSMNRLLTHEFPAFAAGLQSILGVGVVGVLLEAGVQFGEKLAKHIEKAQKAMEDFREAAEKVKNVSTEIAGSWEERIGKLGWNKQQLLFSEGAQLAQQQLEKLSNELDVMQKKQAAAAGWWTSHLAAIGDEMHRVFSTDTTKMAEQGIAEFSRLRTSIEAAFAVDQVKGTDTALKAISDDILSIQEKIEAAPFLASFAADLPNLQRQLDYLNQIKTAIEEQRDTWQKAKAAADAHADAAERQLKAAQALAALQRDIAGGMGKLLPEIDPLKKLASEMSAFKIAAENDFRDIFDSVASQLETDTAGARLDEYEDKLDRIMVKARQDADLAKAIAGLPSTVPASAFGAAPGVGGAGRMPVLGAGGVAGSQLDTFAKDAVAQLALIARAQEAAMPPLEKYAIEWQKLEIAFAGRTDAASAATKQAAENALIEASISSTVKAADAAWKLEERMQKLLERSTDASAGMRAFLIQLQIDSSQDARFVFDALMSATKGFEDTATHSIVSILETHKNQHLKLIHELRSMWESYFSGLAEMALKHGLEKALSPLLNKLPGWLGGDKDAAAAGNTSALVANTHALMMLAAKMGVGGGVGFGIPGVGGGGGGASVGGGLDTGGQVGMFAEGGYASPGSSFITGEAGMAEGVSLDRAGGARITPLGGKASGDTHNHFHMEGSVVTEELVRRAEMASAMAHTEGRSVARAVSMNQEISRRSRPGR
jgi:hypothetical protein